MFLQSQEKRQIKHQMATINKGVNMYMLALEYASQRISEGVSFTEVLTFLTDNHIPLEKDITDSFQWWFFNNFYHPDTIKAVKNSGLREFQDFDFTKYYTTKLPMTSDAYFELLRYKDINQIKQFVVSTNKNIKKSIKLNTISIWLTGFLIIVMVVLSIFMLFSK